jgi:DNA polymerase-3 subunit epsilon
LFVGDLGSPAWKYGNIGGKIVKAQKLQDNGGKIKIISEKNLFEFFNNKS